MGLILSPSEVRSYIEVLRSYLNTSMECYGNAQQKVEQYAENKELLSVSWEASKETMHVCYQAILNEMQSVQDSILSDLDTLDGSVGDEYLDEDELEAKIKMLQAESQQYENSIAQWKAFSNSMRIVGSSTMAAITIAKYKGMIQSNEAEIAELRKKVNFLHEVENSTTNLFQSVIDLLNAVANAIHDGGVVISGGTDFIGSDLLPLSDALLEQTGEQIIDKYLDEELLTEIGFDVEKMKEVYGPNVLEELKQMMLDAGIDNEYSVAIFIATMAIESAYGTAKLEYADGGGTYTGNVKGAGLLQVTGETQKIFLESLLETETDPKLREKIEIYCENFHTIDESSKKNDNIALTVDSGKYYEILEGKTCAEFIAEEYPVYSAVWFWKENASFSYGNATEERSTAESMDDFIVRMSGQMDNKDNLFLITQMRHNGTEYFSSRLEEFCQYSEDFKVVKTGNETCPINGKTHFTGYCFMVPEDSERHSYGPNGWDERKAAWDILKGEINE